jgi:hypothetical protein
MTDVKQQPVKAEETVVEKGIDVVEDVVDDIKVIVEDVKEIIDDFTHKDKTKSETGTK